MKLVGLKIYERKALGTGQCKKLRKSRMIPGVAYRKGQNWLIQSDKDYLMNLFRRFTTAQIFQLDSDLAELNGKLAIVKDIQMDYISRTPLHYDLQIVLESDKIEVEVPLVFIGDAVGVKNSGGLLSILKHHLMVRCFPLSIPEEISVDISHLDVGDSLHVGEIKLPEGVEHAEDIDDPVASVVKEEETAETSEQSQ